jgi:Uma2 family endonuclease
MALHRSSVLSLEAGDHMSREEFERRYAMRPDIHKAELVQGVVHVPSPVKIPEHGTPAGTMAVWIGLYALTHADTQFATDGTVRLSPVDVVQPDVMLWRTEGGSARLDADHYIEGAPELVVEVAASSATYDLHTKKESYRLAGVKEYIVWRTLDAAIDWFRLTDSEYELVAADDEGAIESAHFPGLRLNVPLMLSGDAAAILPPGLGPQS